MWLGFTWLGPTHPLGLGWMKHKAGNDDEGQSSEILEMR
jgi:hypothetical protein